MTPRVLTSATFGLALIVLAVVLGLGACAAPAAPPRATAVPDGAARLTVMTYNVNFGLAGDAETLAAVSAGAADVVVLVETTPAWERVLRATLSAEYPHMAFRHCCGAGGLAVLSRFPVDEGEVLPIVDAGWFPAWRFVVASPLGPVQMLAVHLRPPLSPSGSVVSGYFSTRRVRRAEIEAHVAALDPSLPTLILGDFNEDEGGRALRFLGRHGWASVLPRFAPRAHTWRWPTGLGEVTERLDHIVHDRRLVPQDARVLDVGRSDHLPVVAVFARAATAPAAASLSWSASPGTGSF